MKKGFFFKILEVQSILNYKKTVCKISVWGLGSWLRHTKETKKWSVIACIRRNFHWEMLLWLDTVATAFPFGYTCIDGSELTAGINRFGLSQSGEVPSSGMDPAMGRHNLVLSSRAHSLQRWINSTLLQSRTALPSARAMLTLESVIGTIVTPTAVISPLPQLQCMIRTPRGITAACTMIWNGIVRIRMHNDRQRAHSDAQWSSIWSELPWQINKSFYISPARMFSSFKKGKVA